MINFIEHDKPFEFILNNALNLIANKEKEELLKNYKHDDKAKKRIQELLINYRFILWDEYFDAKARIDNLNKKIPGYNVIREDHKKLSEITFLDVALMSTDFDQYTLFEYTKYVKSFADKSIKVINSDSHISQYEILNKIRMNYNINFELTSNVDLTSSLEFIILECLLNSDFGKIITNNKKYKLEAAIQSSQKIQFQKLIETNDSIKINIANSYTTFNLNDKNLIKNMIQDINQLKKDVNELKENNQLDPNKKKEILTILSNEEKDLKKLEEVSTSKIVSTIINYSSVFSQLSIECFYPLVSLINSENYTITSFAISNLKQKMNMKLLNVSKKIKYNKFEDKEKKVKK